MDLCKPIVVEAGQRTKPKIPEAVGILCGVVYLVCMYIFIPAKFGQGFIVDKEKFQHQELVEYMTALVGVTCILLLGFADDVLDLPWRLKLLLPAIAALPLLVVYHSTYDVTFVVVPKPFRSILGQSVDLGLLYYVYMGMVVVFSTNAINILAGINGLECGQSFVIGLSVVVYNCVELYLGQGPAQAHIFSIHLLLPFLTTTAGLLKFNWYPAQVFVGDTYCYFAGMMFATVGVLGHFSKTLLLFFIPQVINFVYSVPQIFHFVPCPRHRLPRYNPVTNKLEMSTVRFKAKELGFLGNLSVSILESLGLLKVYRNLGDTGEYMECNNFTVINLVLKLFGPMHERTTVSVILLFQVVCSILAFTIRYPLASLFYEV